MRDGTGGLGAPDRGIHRIRGSSRGLELPIRTGGRRRPPDRGRSRSAGVPTPASLEAGEARGASRDVDGYPLGGRPHGQPTGRNGARAGPVRAPVEGRALRRLAAPRQGSPPRDPNPRPLTRRHGTSPAAPRAHPRREGAVWPAPARGMGRRKARAEWHRRARHNRSTGRGASEKNPGRGLGIWGGGGGGFCQRLPATEARSRPPRTARCGTRPDTVDARASREKE